MGCLSYIVGFILGWLPFIVCILLFKFVCNFSFLLCFLVFHLISVFQDAIFRLTKTGILHYKKIPSQRTGLEWKILKNEAKMSEIIFYFLVFEFPNNLFNGGAIFASLAMTTILMLIFKFLL